MVAPRAPVVAALVRSAILTPVVTVVVPCFNYGRFVADCVRSLERQTLPAWRAIVIDDASTDGETPALCDAVRSERVTVVHNPRNLGLSDVRNLGVEMAETEALLNLDADDELEPDHLATTVPLLESDECCGIVYTDYRFFGGEHGSIFGRPFDARRLYVKQYIYAGSLYRKSAFMKTPRYRQEVIGNEDWDLWLSIVEAGYRGHYVPRPLYRQRKHGAQWSAQKVESLADQVLRSREVLCQLHAEGYRRSGQLRQFTHRTWLDDALLRLRAGDAPRARRSLRRAIRAQPWSLRPFAVWLRSYRASPLQ